jgi:hypothetical protein
LDFTAARVLRASMAASMASSAPAVTSAELALHDHVWPVSNTRDLIAQCKEFWECDQIST